MKENSGGRTIETNQRISCYHTVPRSAGFTALWACPHLREDERLRVAAVQAEDEADGLEQLLDAGAELFLLHAAGGARVQDPRLDDELEEILQRLRAESQREGHTHYDIIPLQMFYTNRNNWASVKDKERPGVLWRLVSLLRSLTGNQQAATRPESQRNHHGSFLEKCTSLC